MCFSIPKKVLKVKKNTAVVEGGKRVQLGTDTHVRTGQYLRVVGNIAVGTLSQREGLKVRQLIQSLNNTYV